jgi:hypothetical protein
MKIISYLNAVTTFPVAWEELRPINGAPFTFIVEALKTRYQFQNAGQSLAGAQIGLTTPHLQAGMFASEGDNIQFNQLDFRPTDVAIGSGTTEQTEKIAKDLFSFLRSLGFREPPENYRKRQFTYSSVIVADLGPSIEKIFSRWAKITSFIQKSLPSEQVRLVPFGVKFMEFQGDVALGERQFIFERRQPSPPGENWIFSNGPFDTKTHVKVLEMIETEFGA